MALRYSLSYPGTFQGVSQLCILWFYDICVDETCRNDAMLAESMGQLGDKLVVQHYVCLNAGESFTTDNQQAQHPNIYLRSAEVHFGVVFRDD